MSGVSALDANGSSVAQVNVSGPSFFRFEIVYSWNPPPNQSPTSITTWPGLGSGRWLFITNKDVGAEYGHSESGWVQYSHDEFVSLRIQTPGEYNGSNVNYDKARLLRQCDSDGCVFQPLQPMTVGEVFFDPGTAIQEIELSLMGTPNYYGAPGGEATLILQYRRLGAPFWTNNVRTFEEDR